MNIHTLNIHAVMYNNQSFNKAYYGNTLIFPPLKDFKSETNNYVKVLFNQVPSQSNRQFKIFGYITAVKTVEDARAYISKYVKCIYIIDINNRIVKEYTSNDFKIWDLYFDATDHPKYSVYLNIEDETLNKITDSYLEIVYCLTKSEIPSFEGKYVTMPQMLYDMNDDLNFIEICNVDYLEIYFTNNSNTTTRTYSFIGYAPEYKNTSQLSYIFSDNSWTTVRIPEEYRISYFGIITNYFTKSTITYY